MVGGKILNIPNLVAFVAQTKDLPPFLVEGYCIYPRKSRKSSVIHLVEAAEISEHGIETYTKARVEGMHIQLVTALNSRLRDAARFDYSDIYNVAAVQIDHHGLSPDDTILSVEILNFVPKMPVPWRHIREVAEAVQRAIRKGSWPTFILQSVSYVEVLEAKTIRFEPNDELFDWIERLHAEPARELNVRLRKSRHGLLPVGLKIHCLDKKAPGIDFLSQGLFAVHNAGTCFNLPPIGSVKNMEEMLGVIEKRAGVSFLNNLNYQIQVCSPGELSARHAAILGICTYLGTDTLRRYKQSEFVTNRPEGTGARLIIYGAGMVDKSFGWWRRIEYRKDGVGERTEQAYHSTPPLELDNRTDVLACQSLKDIENVNLVSTLLIHQQFNGLWAELGAQFERDVESILEHHQLMGLLTVPWVKPRRVASPPEDDQTFFVAFEELMTYAFAEAERITAAGGPEELPPAERGILYEVGSLLEWYRQEIVRQWNLVEKGSMFERPK